MHDTCSTSFIESIYIIYMSMLHVHEKFKSSNTSDNKVQMYIHVAVQTGLASPILMGNSVVSLLWLLIIALVC